jgi:hypothetical protein
MHFSGRDQAMYSLSFSAEELDRLKTENNSAPLGAAENYLNVEHHEPRAFSRTENW